MKNWQYIFVIVLFCSCTSTVKQEKPEEISEGYSIIDLTEVEYSDVSPKLSEFADSISYIRLDEEPLIGGIWNSAVVVVDDAIFIDCEQIYKYTLDGKYVMSLFKKGNGPGEAIKFNRGVYNFDKEYVTFANNAGACYNSYSFDGKFVGNQNKVRDEDPDDKFDVEKTKGNKIICGYHNNMQAYCYGYNPFPAKRGEVLNPYGPVLLYLKDLTTDSVIYKLRNFHFDFKATKQGPTAMDSGFPADYGTVDSIFWVKPNTLDTIYRTTDFKSLRPWYVFKQKNSATDHTFQVRAILMDVDKSEFSREGGLSVYALESGVIFEYRTSAGYGKGYCKAGGKVKNISRAFENDLDDYLKELTFDWLGQRKLFQRNGYLYALVSAEEFFKEGSKSPFPDLTEESNPVIVKMKLKKYTLED